MENCIYDIFKFWKKITKSIKIIDALPGYNSPLWNILMLESEVLNFANNSPTQNVFLSFLPNYSQGGLRKGIKTETNILSIMRK